MTAASFRTGWFGQVLTILSVAGVSVATAVPARSAGPLRDMRRPSHQSLVRPVAVFGSDDRTNVPREFEQVARKIGLLFNNRTRTVCTAFCVAENIVATASHCLGRSSGKVPTRYSDFVFARDFDRIRDFSRIEGASRGAGGQHILAGSYGLKTRPPIDAINDWALFRLDRKGCPGGGLPFAVMSSGDLMGEAAKGRIFQISYHRDWAQWRPAFAKACPVGRDFKAASWKTISSEFVNPESMVLHTCDTGGGSSGSPVFAMTANGPAVVAINVGTYVQSDLPSGKRGREATAKMEIETVANTAVNAEIFIAHIERLASAAILPSTQSIKELQDLLIARGFLADVADGSYGPKLKAAIVAYERANGLPPSGLATKELLLRLTAQAAHAARSGALAPTRSHPSGLR